MARCALPIYLSAPEVSALPRSSPPSVDTKSRSNILDTTGVNVAIIPPSITPTPTLIPSETNESATNPEQPTAEAPKVNTTPTNPATHAAISSPSTTASAIATAPLAKVQVLKAVIETPTPPKIRFIDDDKLKLCTLASLVLTFPLPYSALTPADSIADLTVVVSLDVSEAMPLSVTSVELPLWTHSLFVLLFFSFRLVANSLIGASSPYPALVLSTVSTYEVTKLIIWSASAADTIKLITPTTFITAHPAFTACENLVLILFNFSEIFVPLTDSVVVLSFSFGFSPSSSVASTSFPSASFTVFPLSSFTVSCSSVLRSISPSFPLILPFSVSFTTFSPSPPASAFLVL